MHIRDDKYPARQGFKAVPPMICEAFLPSKHESLNQCWINVGSPSATLAQH